jgi:hypothetical integral membrane protein (TIGR02206 family)
MESDFQFLGPSHLAALAVSAAAAGLFIRFHRNPATATARKRRVHAVLAALLVITVLLDPTLTWWRYGADPSYAWQVLKKNSLPLHLCDVVAFILAAALVTGSQRLAEFGYVWGFAGTVQGLVTPGLEHGFPAPDFFAQHGGIPAIAAGLVFGAGLRPLPGALWRTFGWINVYLAVILVLNWLLGTNYGYVNAKPPHPSLLDFLGPWPWYLLVLQGVALLLFGLLLLPFRGRRPNSDPGKTP